MSSITISELNHPEFDFIYELKNQDILEVKGGAMDQSPGLLFLPGFSVGFGGWVSIGSLQLGNPFTPNSPPQGNGGGIKLGFKF